MSERGSVRLGVRRVEEALNWEVSVQNLIGAYDDLLSRPLRRREGGRRGPLAKLRRG